MEGLEQIGLPFLGIMAVATATFYAVSFAELREKSFRVLDELEEDEEESSNKPWSLSSRQRRARRNAGRKHPPKSS